MNSIFQSLKNANIVYSILLVVSIGLLASAYYFQYADGLNPCPLCITQRFFVLLVGIFSLLALIHRPAKALFQNLYPTLIIISSACGAFFAGRMLWLQGLPADEVPDCGPGLSYILQSYQIFEAFEVLLRGDGSCSEVQWLFLGLSMPAWVLLAFFAMIAAALWVMFWQHKKRSIFF